MAAGGGVASRRSAASPGPSDNNQSPVKRPEPRHGCVDDTVLDAAAQVTAMITSEAQDNGGHADRGPVPRLRAPARPGRRPGVHARGPQAGLACRPAGEPGLRRHRRDLRRRPRISSRGREERRAG